MLHAHSYNPACNTIATWCSGLAQAQLASRRGRKAAITAKPTSDGALAFCKEAKQTPDAVNSSSFQETKGSDAAAASVQTELTSKSTDCGAQASNNEVPIEKNQEQSSQRTRVDRAIAEGGVACSKSDTSKTDVLVPDSQTVKAGSSGTGTNSDRGASGSSIATGTVLQEKLGSTQGNAVLAISDAGNGRNLPRKGSCTDDGGLATVELKSARQRGDQTCYPTFTVYFCCW